MSMFILIGIAIVYGLLLFLRLLYILPTINPTPPPRRLPSAKTHLAIVLGSGGHTAEALRLLSTLNLHKFTHRTYIVSSGDAFSAQKAVEFERERGGKDSSYTIKEIPRARRVGQSWLSTPESCARSFAACLWALAGDRPTGFWNDAHLIVCNGPGTAVVVVLASLVFKFAGLKCRTIYVESFARVKSLSLSGKILYQLVDRFIVQWPGLAKSYPRAEYHGVLV